MAPPPSATLASFAATQPSPCLPLHPPWLQHVLEGVGGPLLCSTAKGEDGDRLPDAAVLLDMYGPRGLDFIVDTGFGGSREAEGTTVIDMTGVEPVLVREGKGDPSLFISE